MKRERYSLAFKLRLSGFAFFASWRENLLKIQNLLTLVKKQSDSYGSYYSVEGDNYVYLYSDGDAVINGTYNGLGIDVKLAKGWNCVLNDNTKAVSCNPSTNAQWLIDYKFVMN